MHVAQFVHRYPPALGGAEAWTARLSRHLVAAGHQVTVFTTTARALSSFTEPGLAELTPGTTVESGVTVRRFRLDLRWPGRRVALGAASLVPVRSWQAMVVPWAPISLGLWQAAGRIQNVDVVHALAFPYAPVIRSALRLARRRGVPFVITPFLHLGDPDDPRDRIRRAYTAPHLRWLLRRAARVLVQTTTEQDAVCRMGIPEGRVTLQGLGVDPAECTGGNRAAARESWAVRPEEVVIGHLANLSAEKGTIDLVRAAAKVAEQGVPIRLVLAGPAMPSFTQFLARFGHPEWLTILGTITDEQKRDFFAAIDAFALPSKSDSFGLVFLEAWANGLPVIGYRAGGVADLIRHEVDGWLVPCGDLTTLGEAIRHLVLDPAKRRLWGETGRNRLGEFDWIGKLRIATNTLTDWS